MNAAAVRARMVELLNKRHPLWLEYLVDGPDRALDVCGLCGDTGYIGPVHHTRRTPLDIRLSKRPCICPTGRAKRRMERRWP